MRTTIRILTVVLLVVYFTIQAHAIVPPSTIGEDNGAGCSDSILNVLEQQLSGLEEENKAFIHKMNAEINSGKNDKEVIKELRAQEKSNLARIEKLRSQIQEIGKQNMQRNAWENIFWTLFMVFILLVLYPAFGYFKSKAPGA